MIPCLNIQLELQILILLRLQKLAIFISNKKDQFQHLMLLTHCSLLILFAILFKAKDKQSSEEMSKPKQERKVKRKEMSILLKDTKFQDHCMKILLLKALKRQQLSSLILRQILLSKNTGLLSYQVTLILMLLIKLRISMLKMEDTSSLLSAQYQSTIK